jgi:hypothetical protein
MIGNVSKSKGFKGDRGYIGIQGVQGIQGIQGEKGNTPNIIFHYDEDTGDLSYSSDGILLDKQYVSDNGFATKDDIVLKRDERLITNDKTVIGAINEVASRFIVSVTIKGGADNWIAEPVADSNGVEIGYRYGQKVTVANANITPHSKVDLQLSSVQAVIFQNKSLAFVTENDDGEVTVYCVGAIPENDYTIQVTVTEVIINA